MSSVQWENEGDGIRTHELTKRQDILLLGKQNCLPGLKFRRVKLSCAFDQALLPPQGIYEKQASIYKDFPKSAMNFG